MNKDKFWEIIQETKESCKDNIEGMVMVLESKLNELPLEDIKMFCGIFDTYHKAAYKEGLISVGALMNDGISDDGFIDFRYWLISQGRNIYMQMLKNPESLADTEMSRVGNRYFFESFGYAAGKVVEKKTGKYEDSYVELNGEIKDEILSEIEFGDYLNARMEEKELKERFPKFAERFINENMTREYSEEERKIKTVTPDFIKGLKNHEGIIFRDCNDAPLVWLNGINELLTEEKILLEGTKFESAARFQNNGQVCMLFEFNEDIKIDMGKLAIWRLRTQPVFGGIWLSDYIDIHLAETTESMDEKIDISM